MRKKLNKIIKKSFLFTLLIFSLEVQSKINAQDAKNDEIFQNSIEGSQEKQTIFSNNQNKEKNHFFLCFEPIILINTEDTKDSAPSPVIYPLSFGFKIPIVKKIFFMPRANLFFNYYLWKKDQALPAEIENRTGSALSLLIDLNFGTKILNNEHHTILWSAGPAVLARYAFLSNDVNENDFGTSGTAKTDVENINKWFWQNGNFLLLNANLNYLFHFKKNFAAGPEIRFYIPVSSIFLGKPINGAIFSLGLKAEF